MNRDTAGGEDPVEETPPQRPGTSDVTDPASPRPGEGPVAPSGTDGAPEPGTAPDLSGEQALRRLLHETVDGIEPAPDALQTLRDAVPARRQRRHRVAVAATTVAVLAVGTPVTLQAASVGDANDRPPEASVEGDGGSTGTDGTTGDGPGTHDSGGATVAGGGSEGHAEEPEAPGAEDSDGDGEPDRAENDPLAASYPRCDRDQLGDASTEVDDPVEGGLVYGTIRLRNVSDDTCRIRGTDELTAVPADGADDSESSASVSVVDRVEGDRATDLPLEEAWHEELVLKPGEAYEVAFAWVPRDGGAGCAVTVPDDGGSADDDTDTGERKDTATLELPDEEDGDAGSGGDGGDSGGTGGSGGSGDDEEVAGGVVVRYTPAAGQPRAARFELESSCAGSLHRTGVLEASEE